MLQLLTKLAKDESGGEVIEAVLSIGMIVCACLVLMSTLGIKAMAKWQSISDLLN